MTLSLQYKGFDYVAFFKGAYEDSDSLPELAQTGADSIEATLDYGIDVNTSQVVADQNYTDSLTALGSTIAQAEQLGLTVMVRPSGILWYNASTGDTEEWLIDNGQWAGSVDLGLHPGGAQIAGVGAFAGSGTSGILWHSPS